MDNVVRFLDIHFIPSISDIIVEILSPFLHIEVCGNYACWDEDTFCRFKYRHVTIQTYIKPDLEKYQNFVDKLRRNEPVYNNIEVEDTIISHYISYCNFNHLGKRYRHVVAKSKNRSEEETSSAEIILTLSNKQREYICDKFQSFIDKCKKDIKPPSDDNIQWLNNNKENYLYSSWKNIHKFNKNWAFSSILVTAERFAEKFSGKPLSEWKWIASNNDAWDKPLIYVIWGGLGDEQHCVIIKDEFIYQPNTDPIKMQLHHYMGIGTGEINLFISGNMSNTINTEKYEVVMFVPP